jgi:hypothetical protein
LPDASLGELVGCSLVFKVETVNPVRCFKGRGTETVVARAGAPRMICASAGNLGGRWPIAGRAPWSWDKPPARSRLGARIEDRGRGNWPLSRMPTW